MPVVDASGVDGAPLSCGTRVDFEDLEPGTLLTTYLGLEFRGVWAVQEVPTGKGIRYLPDPVHSSIGLPGVSRMRTLRVLSTGSSQGLMVSFTRGGPGSQTIFSSNLPGQQPLLLDFGDDFETDVLNVSTVPSGSDDFVLDELCIDGS